MARSASTFASIILGLVLTFAVVSSAAWNLGKATSDWGLPALIPDDPDIALSAAIAEFVETARLPSASVLESAKTAGSFDVLEEEPLLLASLTNTESAHGRAIQILSEARRRNPAAREVRLLLLDRFLRTDDLTGAIGEIGALSALLPADKQSDLAQLLLGLVVAPETRTKAIAALRQSPMRKNLISDLARAGASSFLLLDLSRDLVSFRQGSEEAKWSQTVTQPLVDQGDLAGAKRLWDHYFSLSPDKPTAGVFDETFAGVAAPPFGWQLTPNPGSFAEFGRQGLRVSYDGGTSGIFARELLLLPPGRYRFEYSVSSNDGPLPNLAWRIDCHKTKGTILDLPMIQNYSFEAEQLPEFTVPAEGCTGQWLTLEGRSLEVSPMRTALFRNVKIRPVSVK